VLVFVSIFVSSLVGEFVRVKVGRERHETETEREYLVEHDRRVLVEVDGVDGKRRYVADDGASNTVGERRGDVSKDELRLAFTEFDEFYVH